MEGVFAQGSDRSRFLPQKGRAVGYGETGWSWGAGAGPGTFQVKVTGVSNCGSSG